MVRARRPRASAGRQRARALALQALYQWQLGGDDPGDIRDQFLERRDTAGADVDYFRTLLQGVTAGVEGLDADVAPLLQRSVALVDPVERAILRIACYELRERPEVPARVVINEAVELGKRYGADQGHRFVNGIVDALAHRIRAHELDAAPGRRGP